MHWLLPTVAAAAAGAFAAAVLRQYAARRRPYQLAWGIALSMFAAASMVLTVAWAGGGRVDAPHVQALLPVRGRPERALARPRPRGAARRPHHPPAVRRRAGCL